MNSLLIFSSLYVVCCDAPAITLPNHSVLSIDADVHKGVSHLWTKGQKQVFLRTSFMVVPLPMYLVL